MLRRVLPFMLLPAVAWAFTFNSLGTTKAPLSITSAAKVLAGNQFRRSWCILPEGVDIRCNVGGIDDSAPVVTPTSARGFLVKSNSLVCADTGSNSNTPSSVDPQMRLDCASTAGAVSVDTSESP